MPKKSENGGLEAPFGKHFGDLGIIFAGQFLGEKRVPPIRATCRVNGLPGGLKEAT